MWFDDELEVTANKILQREATRLHRAGRIRDAQPMDRETQHSPKPRTHHDYDPWQRFHQHENTR